MKRRILSIITALALCLSLCPAGALAADPSLCRHHPAHTAECGHAAPTEGAPCGHAHGDECYGEETQCVHVHDELCYGDGLLPAGDGGGTADACAHVCSAESGCVTRTPDCHHAHDGACGYVPADPGAPCAYICKLCPIEALIAALPEQVTEDSADDVRARLDEILALCRELPEDEQRQLDLSRVQMLQRALDGANAPAPAAGHGEQQPGDVASVTTDGGTLYYAAVEDVFTEANSGAVVTLLADITWNGDPITLPANTSFTLRLNGKTMTNNSSDWNKEYVFFLSAVSSSLTVEGDGSIISQSGHAIWVEGGARITVKGGHIATQYNDRSALYVYYDGAADIYGGAFTGGINNVGGALKLYGGVFTAGSNSPSIQTFYQKLRDLLGTAGGKTYAYHDEDGVPITGKLDEEALYGTVMVKECGHTVTGYQTTRETHCLICTVCEKELGTPENHIRDGNVCTVCGHAAVVAETLAGGTTTRYGTLKEAWDAATAPGVTDAVITLVHDVTGNGRILAPVLEEGRSVTLEGRGRTISRQGIGVAGGKLRIENCAIINNMESVLVDGGTAEIKDSVINGMTDIYGGEAELTGCTTGQVYVSGSAATARLTDCTVTGNSMGIYVYNGGTAELTGCTVTGETCGIAIGNGNLTIHSGSFTGTGENGAGLCVNSDASSVTLRGGTFSGASSIEIDGRTALTLGSLLGHTATARYAYYSDETGAPISVGPESKVMAAAVTVQECAVPHTYSHVQGTAVHSLTCASCGAQGAAEPCRYDSGACACGSTLTVALPGELVYNGTQQEPPAAVTLDGEPLDGSRYSVTYGENIRAGTAFVIAAGVGETLPFRVKQTFTIAPAELTVSGVSAESRPYNGSKTVAITDVTLAGILNGDDVSVDTTGLTGTLNGSNAGTYTNLTLPAMTLTGADAGNYTMTRPAGAVPASVTISKAAALTPKTGDLAVANRRAHTYTCGLGALRPDVPEGLSLGSSAVTYELGTVSLGSYYTGGAEIEGQTLKLPIAAVESSSEIEIGTVTVVIHTQNFEDMTAVISVRSVNKIIPEGAPTLSAAALTYGQPLSAIALSGGMTDGNTPVPGKFTWSSPDNRPVVQEQYAAAWVFTPDNTGKYAAVTGTAVIQVLPAPIAGAEIVLEPAAFRQDGAAHRPVVAGVTLNGITLAANVDYTAAIPEGTEAGTYTVTLTGKGNYTGTATAVFIINPVEQKPLDQKDDDGHDLRLEVETGLSTVPEALKTNEQFNTPGKIETALRTRVAEVISNVGEQIAVFDVTLQYKDGSGTWHNVDPDNFPADGVTAVLPYPAGTGATGYTFTVQHLISSGAQAGTMETLPYELTADGLRCKFSSLSPVAIGYQTATKPNPQPNPGGNSGGGSGGGGWSSSTYAVTVEKSEHGKVTSNRTNASNGSTVTLTVTPDSGYVLDALTVTDGRGSEIRLTTQGGGKYTFTMPSRAVTVKATFAPLPDDTQKPCDGGAECPSRGFTDLGTVGTWYHEAVDYVLRNGLMGGYGEGTFGPSNNLTRAQFAQILFNKEGRPGVNYLLTFPDVASEAWYTEAIRWAAS